MTLLLLLLACGTPSPTEATPPPPAPPAPAAVPAPTFPAPLVGPALVDVGAGPHPDVIVVSIDTLRADHLGAYGHDRPTSPFIDGLAAKGVRFAHARSPSPWTLPAHTTLLTGQLPTTHRVVDDTLKLSVDVPVLPELLHQRGYATAGSVSTLFVSSKFGFDRGFHHFQDYGILHKKLNLAGLVQMDDVVDDVSAYVQSVPADRPLFLFLHTYDAHYAYDPPAPYDTLFDRAPEPSDPSYRSYGYYRKNPPSQAVLEHQIAQYDESIRWIDDQLARLSEELRKAGRNPRWVITADHGEEFGERGSWGHGHTLYAEQLRIPLIVSGPGLPQGVVVEEPVGLQDVAPTVAAWTGVTDLSAPDGIDLSPYLDGSVAAPARPFLAETSRHRTLRYSLYEDGQRVEWDVQHGTIERFADPSETEALADEGMQPRLVELLGAPWSAKRAGEVRVVKGRTVPGEARRVRAVEADERFGVLPFDATFRLVGEPPGKPVSLDDASTGDFTWHGGTRPVSVDLDQDTKAALEALGYVHGDE